MVPEAVAGAAGPDDRRLQRQLFTSIRDGTRRFGSVNELLETFVRPLSSLISGTLPHSLDGVPVSTSSTTAEEILGPTVIEAVQEALLLRVSVDWQDALDHERPGALEDLLDLWLFGTPSADKRKQGALQTSAVKVISRALSSGRMPVSRTASTSSMTLDKEEDASASRPDLHPKIADTLLHLCAKAVNQLSLASMLAQVLAERNKARRQVSWSDTLRSLASIPDRIANFTRGQTPVSLKREGWLSKVFVKGIANALQDKGFEGDEEAARLLADAIIRLDRIGYLGLPEGDELSFWQTMLREVLGEIPDGIQSSGVARKWSSMRSKLPTDVRKRIHSSLMRTLDTQARKQRQGGMLVTPREKATTGTEGTVFLSKESQAFVAAALVCLRTFLVPTQSARVSKENDSDEDEDDDDDDEVGTSSSSRLATLFNTLALDNLNQSPVLAWTWTMLLSSQPDAEDVVPSTLASALQVWCNQSKLATFTLEGSQYLTTLIVTLLASTESHDRVVALSHSKALLEGVLNHLEHPEPVVRRMGMLVAELFSSRTKKEGEKGLNFGKSIWDGAGQGKEEARLLRALYLGWQALHLSVTKLADSMKPESVLKALDLERVEDKQVATVTTDTVLTRGRAKPVSRKIPATVAPPSRRGAQIHEPRKLITMLDEDSGTEDFVDEPAETQQHPPLLKMFSKEESASSHRASRFTQPANHESSSSSDDANSSDSSGDEHEGEDSEIHKLAADLAGLDASSASSLLDAAKSATSSTRQRSGRQKDEAKKGRKSSFATPFDSSNIDFDKDREQHAPRFGEAKKTARGGAANRIPVYVSDLSALLKSNDRRSIKTGLKYISVLIRNKSHRYAADFDSFGSGEVEENCIDLSITLIALQNNFSISNFDLMKKQGLVALVTCSPASCRLTMGVLTEQVFGSQYSIAQRMVMLESIAEAAVELSTGEAGLQEQGKGSKAVGVGVGHLAKQLSDSVVAETKEKGEREIPAVRRQKDLLVNRRNTPDRSGSARPLIEQVSSGSGFQNSLVHKPNSSSRSFFNGTHLNGTDATKKADRGINWNQVSGPVFIFPLLNRFLAYYSHFLGSHSGTRGAGYMGAGTSAFFGSSTETLSLFLDTVTVLVDMSIGGGAMNTSKLSLHSAAEITSLVLECLQMVLPRLTIHLLPMQTTMINGAEPSDTKGVLPTLSSSLNLLLVTMNKWSAFDPTFELLSQSASQTQDVMGHLINSTTQVFEFFQHQHQHQQAPNQQRNLHLQITSRAAAILILTNQINTAKQAKLRSLIGFDPA